MTQSQLPSILALTSIGAGFVHLLIWLTSVYLLERSNNETWQQSGFRPFAVGNLEGAKQTLKAIWSPTGLASLGLGYRWGAYVLRSLQVIALGTCFILLLFFRPW